MQINIKLDDDFTEALQRLKKKFGKALTELNGMSQEQLSFTEFIDAFIDKNEVSIDTNANSTNRDICSLENEMTKPHTKLLALNKLFYDMKKFYGLEEANRWLENEWIGIFYLHDFHSATLKPYCFAYDVKRLATDGLWFIEGFNNQPPKHLITFTDFLGEFVSFASNRTSGACGLPSALVWMYYFWKRDCASNYLGMNTPEQFARYRDNEFQRLTYKLNQPYLRVNQSAFTNFSIFDRYYYEALFGSLEFPDGTFAIDCTDEFLEFEKAYMNVVSQIREVNVMTFPVLTFSLLRKDGKFLDEDFAKWACLHNMKWADSNFYISDDVTSLSSCCRLLSDINNLGFFNSVGGTALEVGSVKVNTINLARIAYESDVGDYTAHLADYVEQCCKLLAVQRHIIARNVEKGLLPNYSKDLMHMENQYSTIGIIGLYEAMQHYGDFCITQDEFGYTYYTDAGMEFAQSIMDAIIEAKKPYENGFRINIEQIPGERAASVLMEKDRLFHPNERYELPLYGNQFIPLGVKCTLHEKIRVSAILDKACSGGSISHINIDTPLTDFDTAWRMLNYCADQGVVYFAFCTRISACEQNHGFYGETCPICGGPKVTTYQRIVGFLTPERSYSTARRAEFKLRDWFDVNRMEEM